jgi:hypothetical protein
MESAPKDGRLLLLLIDGPDREHPLEDIPESSITIGFNNEGLDGEDEWRFAGWCWTHDHFVEGKGTPVGWKALPSERS